MTQKAKKKTRQSVNEDDLRRDGNAEGVALQQRQKESASVWQAFVETTHDIVTDYLREECGVEIKSPEKHKRLIGDVKNTWENFESNVGIDGGKISVKSDVPNWSETKEEIDNLKAAADMLVTGLTSQTKNATFVAMLNHVRENGPDYFDDRFEKGLSELPGLQRTLEKVASVNLIARRPTNPQWIQTALVKCHDFWRDYQKTSKPYPKYKYDSNQVPANTFTHWVLRLVQEATSEVIVDPETKETKRAATIEIATIRTEMEKAKKRNWRIEADGKSEYF